MAQILIRGLSTAVLERLKGRARYNGRTLQAELKTILQQAAGGDVNLFRKRLSKVHEMLGKKRFSDSVSLIREDRRR
jgi:plasmid stability protein